MKSSLLLLLALCALAGCGSGGGAEQVEAVAQHVDAPFTFRVNFAPQGSKYNPPGWTAEDGQPFQMNRGGGASKSYGFSYGSPLSIWSTSTNPAVLGWLASHPPLTSEVTDPFALLSTPDKRYSSWTSLNVTATTRDQWTVLVPPGAYTINYSFGAPVTSPGQQMRDNCVISGIGLGDVVYVAGWHVIGTVSAFVSPGTGYNQAINVWCQLPAPGITLTNRLNWLDIKQTSYLCGPNTYCQY